MEEENNNLKARNLESILDSECNDSVVFNKEWKQNKFQNFHQNNSGGKEDNYKEQDEIIDMNVIDKNNVITIENHEYEYNSGNKNFKMFSNQ